MKKVFLFALLFVSSFLNAQSIAWERCNQLGKGMNLSWLETWWNGSAALAYSDYLDLEKLPQRKADIDLMMEMGISTIRLPTCFEVWEYNTPPYTIDHPEYFSAIDSVIIWAKAHNQKVIIDYQHGSLNDCNFDRNLARLRALWKQIATHFKDSDPEQVFFELFNEPHDISRYNWQTTAKELIKTIRPIVPNHTLIIGGIEYNGIAGLNQLQPFSDDNIIYTFHFYEPFLFTHQGADWVGDPVATTEIPYPYQKETMPPMDPACSNTFGEFLHNKYFYQGQDKYVRNYLETVKKWSLEKRLPVFCGEWGSHYLADQESRCRHAKIVYQYLQELDLPHCYWEWDRNFSFFEQNDPSFTNLPPCMEEIWNSTIPSAPQNLSADITILTPNPIVDQLEIYFPDPEAFDQLEIFTASGKLMGQYFIGGTSLTKNISDWPMGLYVLHFKNWTSGERYVQKVLKQ